MATTGTDSGTGVQGQALGWLSGASGAGDDQDVIAATFAEVDMFGNTDPFSSCSHRGARSGLGPRLGGSRVCCDSDPHALDADHLHQFDAPAHDD